MAGSGETGRPSMEKPYGSIFIGAIKGIYKSPSSYSDLQPLPEHGKGLSASGAEITVPESGQRVPMESFPTAKDAQQDHKLKQASIGRSKKKMHIIELNNPPGKKAKSDLPSSSSSVFPLPSETGTEATTRPLGFDHLTSQTGSALMDHGSLSAETRQLNLPAPGFAERTIPRTFSERAKRSVKNFGQQVLRWRPRPRGDEKTAPGGRQIAGMIHDQEDIELGLPRASHPEPGKVKEKSSLKGLADTFLKVAATAGVGMVGIQVGYGDSLPDDARIVLSAGQIGIAAGFITCNLANVLESRGRAEWIARVMTRVGGLATFCGSICIMGIFLPVHRIWIIPVISLTGGMAFLLAIFY